MGMGVPKYLEAYLNNADRKPLTNWVNNGDYYAGLDYHWITYMQNVVRKCIAYGTQTVDGVHNSLLSAGTGYGIVQGAAKLIKGERAYFDGDDEACAFLSDIWSEKVGFNTFLDRAILFMLLGGTCPIKINYDGLGRTSLSAYRIDRTIFSTDDAGNVTDAVFYVGLLSSLKSDAVSDNYWLIEHRKYDENRLPTITYKVFRRSGTATSETLPSPYLSGLSYKGCPVKVKRELDRLGVRDLNCPSPLPTNDGLGVWLLRRTPSNSCVPDVFMGDPLLYGVTDLLWSMDAVFTGSLVDVINGRGKILVPKQFLSQITKMLDTQGLGVTTSELDRYDDESFVYIQPSVFDKDKQSPTPIQFDIRSAAYREMFELYEREAAVRVGFSPTTLFPHLSDNSVRTATEVTAEENMTQASVQSIHGRIIPELNRAIREVLQHEGYSTSVNIRLSDHIGNKIQRDENLRANYQAGGMPQSEFVQQLNNLSKKETDEWCAMINEEREAKKAAMFGSDPTDMFGNLE